MNFRQKITVILLLTLVLGSTAFAQLVGIPDPNLRAAVRAELKLPADAAITQGRYEPVNTLNCIQQRNH